MTNAAVKILVVTAFVVSGCDGSSDAGPDQSAEKQALAQNVALWQRSNISNYQYTYRKTCFCPIEDIVIVVKNGQISEAFRLPSGVYLAPQELVAIPTVDGLFAKIQEAIDQKAFKINVSYDVRYGFPEIISIDHSQQLADDEVTYTAKGFQ